MFCLNLSWTNVRALACAFFISCVAVSARSEYRAFQLAIVDAETGAERMVVSTLDDLQYRQYNFVKPTETVYYVTSWMCRGRTDHRPVCEQTNPQP